jgi:pyruvate,orthophosphate dikinase
MRWTHPLSARVGEGPDLLGGKAHGLITLRRLGLPVPAGFVITSEACRAFRRVGRFPEGLSEEITAAVTALETETGRRFGDPHDPLTVSVRSGAGVSMPGMMSTVLGHDQPGEGLEQAVAAVFSSWDAPRARTYRALNGIPDDLGTAVTVQAMVHGDRDARSGSGVAFTHDPNTGAHAPFGELLFVRRGDTVVSGSALTRPLRDLADREPTVWADLVAALNKVERHYRDACYVEFTFESGRLWLLQVRPARLGGAAAVRAAVDLADSGLINRGEALLRVSPQHLRHARTPRVLPGEGGSLLARGLGACPGVAVGRVATSSEGAVRMAAGGPVVLVRPETSPLDMSGMAAAVGIVTARGGPASHAAVVARSMNTPAVVGVAELVVEPDSIRVGDQYVPEGDLVTVDGTGGEVALGRLRVSTGEPGPHLDRLLVWADRAAGGHAPGAGSEQDRLSAAHTALNG